MEYYEDAAPGAVRARELLNNLERFYLSAMRALALVAATLLLVFAIWLAGSGVYKASRNVSSVKEAPAIVSPQEITDIEVAKPARSSAQPTTDALAGAKQYYADFANRYYSVFKSKFEPYKKPDDRSLDAKAFDQRYLRTGERIAALKEGVVDFEQEKSDLESLLTTMATVADDPKTVNRLRSYKAAKKIAVNRTESGTRPEAYCSYYGIYSGECLSYDVRSVPYSRTVREMRLPAGVISHTDLFDAYQDAYFSKLSQKRAAAAAEAKLQREEIIADNVTGKTQLWSAFGVVAAFLALMFLFLLIALERHQRRIAAAVPQVRGPLE